MCLGISTQNRQIDGYAARGETNDVEHDVGLFLPQREPLAPGDLIMVHVCHA